MTIEKLNVYQFCHATNDHCYCAMFQAVTKKLREIMPNLYGGVSSDQLTLSSNKAFEPYNARGIKGRMNNDTLRREASVLSFPFLHCFPFSCLSFEDYKN